MKSRTLAVLIILLCTKNLSSQQADKQFQADFEKAESIFSKIYQDGKGESLTYKGANTFKGGYSEALPIFLNLYKKDQNNSNLAFKIGVCYQSSKLGRAQAIPYFNKAAASVTNNYKGDSYKEINAPLITFKYLGDVYHLNYEFDKAIEAYGKYKSSMREYENVNQELLTETNRKIVMCETGKRLVSTPVKIKIQNLGSNINSPYADYSPVLSADQNTLFFTTRRPETKGGQQDAEGNYMEDIYTAIKTQTGWSKATSIGAPINTEWHEATVGLTPDGQTILIYKDDLGDGNIYSTTLSGEIWSSPVKLNENINSKYWEPSAFISADGKTLYFSSNRPEGFGGRDLYSSIRKPGGDWEKAINMGANINSAFDEDAPFIHPDGVTLSFSSNDHLTMGGFDIFSSILDNGIWSEAVNVGFPINTTDDDIFYVLSPDSRNAYFTSFRVGGMGEKDIYLATFLDRKQTPLTLMSGVVNDETGKPAKDVEITVTDNETGQIAGVYRTNHITGRFLFILTPGKNYNITYQAKDHLFYSENMEIPMKTNYYEIKRAVSLNPIVVGSKIILNNIFFDFDKTTLRPLSNVELKNLELLMKANPNLKVEISGHTDSKGDNAYNQKLSDGRAQAVVNNLIQNGIMSARMKAKGYGETTPAAPNKNANGDDNPDGRQLNRRAELTITEINAN